LRRIGPSSHVPWGAVLTCGLAAALLGGLFPLALLGELISIGTLCAFVVVCSGVFFLRITRPEITRPFRTPLAMVVCPAGALICIYLLTGLPAATWTRFLTWTAVGLCVYIFYGRRRGLDETP
jgi:APA family basic amino acid/polyamine antiporter